MSQLTVTLKTMTDKKTSKEENSCAQEEWDNIYFKSYFTWTTTLDLTSHGST